MLGSKKPDASSLPGRARRAVGPILLGSTILLSGCAAKGVSFMAPDGPVAALQRQHFWQVTLISLIVVLPVIVGVPLLAWRYRYGNARSRYAPHWSFSPALEWAMWLVPAAIVLILGTVLWIDTHRLDPYKPVPAAVAGTTTPLKVQVVGLDWKWLFIYPEYHIATVGEMAFPQDRPVQLTLTTDTVMQSFMISSLAGQIYAMPGMTTKLNLAADHPGRFVGENTQYSGDGFHSQHFAAVAMSAAGFDAWVRDVRKEGAALDMHAYDRLAASSTPAQVRASFGTPAMPAHVTYFNHVAPGLFRRVLGRYHSGKPLGAADQPGSAAYDARYSG